MCMYIYIYIHTWVICCISSACCSLAVMNDDPQNTRVLAEAAGGLCCGLAHAWAAGEGAKQIEIRVEV